MTNHKEQTADELMALTAAAHTLKVLLEPNWKHMVFDKQEQHFKTITKPAGETFGSREVLEARLKEIMKELGK